MTSTNLYLKTALISTFILSVAVTMKLSLPLILNFAVNDLPAIWFLLISLLKPPYLYLLINGIIITIAATTRFHQNENTLPPLDLTPSSKPPPLSVTDSLPVVYDIEPISMLEPSVVYETTIKSADFDVDTVHEVVSFTSTWHPSDSSSEIKSLKFDYPVKEKQISTSRVSHTRKQTAQGARASRVLKPKKNESMDNTWKMITDGRQMKHLQKSDTFIQHSTSSDEYKKVVKKSETFKDRANYENENQYLQPAASLSQDELNRRVEAFIKKFNDDIRLQRQQSLNQYKDMLNHASH